MDIGFTFTLIVSFAILFIGVLTTYHDKKSVTNKLFAYISLVTVAWSFANYFSLEPILFSQIVWVRLVIFLAVPHVILFYLFVRNFPKINFSIPKYEFATLSVLGICMMALSMTPYVFSGLRIVGGNAIPVPGLLIMVFGIFVIAMLISGVFLIIKKYGKADRKDKTSWRAMLVGFVLSYTLLIITNFVLVNTNGDTGFIVYAPLFMLPSIMGTAYSIIRYRLLNVKTITTEIIIFVLLTVTLVQITLSQTTAQFIFNSVLFCVFMIIGIFLIRSVIKEVELRESLQIANTKLRELDELKSQFLSFASHQLRSPLTAIQGYTSMLLEGDFGEMSEPVRNSVKTVDQSSKSLITIVNEFLDVSRIEQGRMKYDVSDFDIKKLAEEVFTELKPNAEKKGLKFEFLADNDAGCIVNADQGKIKQVIGNIIDNSIKYTETGGIKVQLEHKDKKVQIKVSDSGIGIEPSEIPKLFSMFTRAADAHKTNVSGTGLGLYVAKQMVEAQKGRVWVESPGKGKGSTFYIELPLKTNN